MDKATVLQQHQIQRAAEVVELAARAVLDLAAAATLLEKESGGGHNIYGHDKVQTGGFYEKGGAVTKENFLKYKAHRGEFGAQGVGPTQLTLPAFQDRADERGGCWDWRVNALVGFEILAGLIKAHGTRDGFRRYNGSGKAAEAYADDAMTKLRVWQARLGNAPQPSAPRSDAAPSGTPVLKQGSKGSPVGQLQGCLNKVQRSGLAVDADFGPKTGSAVKTFQRNAGGLTEDGEYGPKTAAKLGVARQKLP
jgi:Putative peptidoglycan binding domain